MKTRLFWLIACLLSLDGSALSRDPEWHVISPYQEIDAPNGFLLFDAPSLKAKRIQPMEMAKQVMVAAYVDTPEGRFYVSDWSWERFQAQKIQPNWVFILQAPSDGKIIPTTTRKSEKDPGLRLSRGNLIQVYSSMLQQRVEQGYNIDPLKTFGHGIKGFLLYGDFVEKLGFICKQKSDDFYDLKPLEAAAGLDVYLEKNQHTLEKTNNFSRLNPDLIRWAHANLIPDPQDKIAGFSCQTLYNRVARNFARMMVLSRIELLKNFDATHELRDYELAVTSGEDILKYFDARFEPKLSGELNEMSRVAKNAAYGDPWTAPQSIGFWLRRVKDGTESLVWDAARELMLAYDSAWFCAQPSPIPIGPQAKNLNASVNVLLPASGRISRRAENLNESRIVLLPAGGEFYDKPDGQVTYATTEPVLIEISGWLDLQNDERRDRWFETKSGWVLPSNKYQDAGAFGDYGRTRDILFKSGYVVRSGVGTLAPVVQVQTAPTHLDVVGEIADETGQTHYVTSWAADSRRDGRFLTTVVPMEQAIQAARTMEIPGGRAAEIKTFADLLTCVRRGDALLHEKSTKRATHSPNRKQPTSTPEEADPRPLGALQQAQY